MITKEERQEIDTAAKAYEEGLKRFYKDHQNVDRVANYVARYRYAYRLTMKRRKEKVQTEKG